MGSAEGSASKLHRNLFLAFLVAGLGTRILFWIYTQRIWEDALIFVTVARSFWDGHGLTHHASEPAVFSFTSPIAQFVAVLGESVGLGIFALKLANLAAAGAALFFAHRICNIQNIGLAGRLLLFSYLAFDHLQVFFGMSGMETQISTAVILAGVYCFLANRIVALGILCGLAALCRPEMAVWPVVAGIGVFLNLGFKPAVKSMACAAAVVAPWLLFATLYYGSPVPQSVVAKSVVFDRAGLFTLPWEVIWQYCLDWWKSIAPFKQYWIAYKAPAPDLVLQIIVLVVTLLALVGTVRAVRDDRRMLAVAAVVFVFAAYRTLYAVGVYFMWYLPPFVALFFLLAAYGLDWAAKRYSAARLAVGIGVAAAYSVPVFIAMPLDRAVQREIEYGVRWRVGETLNELMDNGDSVVLEPLGYIGWVAKDTTIWDYPGLGSHKSLDILRRVKSMVALINEARPTYAVFRPGDFEVFEKYIPEGASAYTPVRQIDAREGLTLRNLGLEYAVIDNHFSIYGLKPEVQIAYEITTKDSQPKDVRLLTEVGSRSDGGVWEAGAIPNGTTSPVPAEMIGVTTSWVFASSNTGDFVQGPIAITADRGRLAVPIIRGGDATGLSLKIENPADGSMIFEAPVDTEWPYGWYWAIIDLRGVVSGFDEIQVTASDAGEDPDQWLGVGPVFALGD